MLGGKKVLVGGEGNCGVGRWKKEIAESSYNAQC